MVKNKKVRLPAIMVEIPRMGNVVFVSEKIGSQDGLPTTMFTAEIPVNGKVELQSFHLKCKTEQEAQRTTNEMRGRIEKFGSFPFIQSSI